VLESGGGGRAGTRCSSSPRSNHWLGSPFHASISEPLPIPAPTKGRAPPALAPRASFVPIRQSRRHGPRDPVPLQLARRSGYPRACCRPQAPATAGIIPIARLV
jgi:hypothetical protein